MMKRTTPKQTGTALLIVAWLLAGAVQARDGQVHPANCPDGTGRLSERSALNPGERVLLVPLLRAEPGTRENERWPEQPARELAGLYRNRFAAQVSWMHGIRTWQDYYRQADQLAKSGPFDRLVFIGHGGLDGPILNEDVLQLGRRIEGTESTVTRAVQTQPGLRHVFSFTYDESRNPAFGHYVDLHWQELSNMGDDDVVRALRTQEEQLQPLDSACFARRCPTAELEAEEDLQARDVKVKACEFVCREPLFVWQIRHDIAADQFFKFMGTLQSLVKDDGLVFFGSCNPGSRVTEYQEPWDQEMFLGRSGLAGGPHESYVHLIAAAAKRAAAGPTGKTSAKDIIDRVRLLENRSLQHHLCVIEPPPPPQE